LDENANRLRLIEVMTHPPAIQIVPAPIPVLLVEPSPADRAFFERALKAAGFRVTVTETFHDAREPLDAQPPQLLVTELRLGAYNGLHLVMRGKARRPDMKAIVTTEWSDHVLQAEAEGLGATFMPKPASEADFLAAVARTCFRHPDDHEPIRAPFERRLVNRRVATLSAYAPERRSAVERRRHHLLAPATVVYSG
jgi:two-component system response regulator RegA